MNSYPPSHGSEKPAYFPGNTTAKPPDIIVPPQACNSSVLHDLPEPAKAIGIWSIDCSNGRRLNIGRSCFLDQVILDCYAWFTVQFTDYLQRACWRWDDIFQASVPAQSGVKFVSISPALLQLYLHGCKSWKEACLANLCGWYKTHFSQFYLHGCLSTSIKKNELENVEAGQIEDEGGSIS